MIKSLDRFLKQRKERYRVPRSVQDLIPVQCIWTDGIFRSSAFYSKTYRFSDINYKVASDEDKLEFYKGYCGILNGLEGGSMAQISIYNHALRRWNLSESELMPMRGDGRDDLRREYNSIISGSTGGKCFLQEKYITVATAKRSIDEARLFFARTGTELENRFSLVGSHCTQMETLDRLRLLHSFYRPRESEHFSFDLRRTIRWGHDFRDYICPDSVERHSDYLKLGKRYVRVLFLKDFASFVRDDFIDALVTRNVDTMVSINILPIPMDEAVREAETRLLGVETNITNWQRRQNANNNFTATIPYDLELQRKEAREFLEDLLTRDQRMMQAIITMVITADSKDELDSETEAVRSFAANRLCQIAPLTFQQMDGLNTALPLGVWKTHAFRTLTTESMGVFTPFKVQEIQDAGGIYFGENAISHNPLLCDRGKLLNQSGAYVGVPGSGKSFVCKNEITGIALGTEDDILVCDPEGEYGSLAKAICGEDAAVIQIRAGGKHRLNAMYMEEGYGEHDPMASKSQFIMSLIEKMSDNGVGSQHKSIIDRCVASVYRDAAENDTVPTLISLREKLLKQPEPQAQEVALSMERFTTGTLDIFSHESNVDLNKRMVVFDIHGLDEQLKTTGLLVITDTILNRVTLNWKRGKRTHIFIDEFHVVYENAYSAAFFDSAWRQFRKRNAYPTAITQNVDFLLNSPQARSMLSNSEFIVMLNQAQKDREQLATLLNISPRQMSYVTNAEAGCGLIKYGSALVPFVNRFPKDTKLYQLMTTKPGEGIFGGETKEDNA